MITFFRYYCFIYKFRSELIYKKASIFLSYIGIYKIMGLNIKPRKSNRKVNAPKKILKKLVKDVKHLKKIEQNAIVVCNQPAGSIQCG